MKETQQTVSEWFTERFPKANIRDIIKELLEEVIAVGIAADKLSVTDVINIGRETFNTLDGRLSESTDLKSRIVNVQIALYCAAAEVDMDLQKYLDHKMEKLRKPTS